MFAALNVATGEVIDRCKPQQRAQDLVAFLREIESTVEPTLDIHVVLDNDRGTPFRWVKTADEILDSMRRFGVRVQQVHGQ